ncbi:MFS transporter [Streptomyces sp. NPDC001339]|uniref:MFS transporter n=1 Tax=Streptomyces sp. NPDC001339 TaxID=3364563 RepID=UPI003678690A
MPQRPPPSGPRSGLPLYLAAAFSARLADEGMAVAVALLALQRSGSAAQGAFVLAAWMAPHVVAAPLVGAFATRMRRPRLCYLGALGGFALGIVALSALIGRAPAPVVLAVALSGGACGPAVSGGLSSLLAVLLPAYARQDRAYALDAAVYNAASVAGPSVAGVVATLASPGMAMALLGGSAALGAALLGGIPCGGGRQSCEAAQQPIGAAPESVTASHHETAADPVPAGGALRTDLMAGLTALWRVRELRALTAGTCLAFAGIGGLTTTAVLLAGYRGHPGAGGALMTAFATGALIGSLAVARWRLPCPDQGLVVAALCGTGLTLGTAALVPSPTADAALFVLAGVCDGPLLTATLRLRAAYAPPRARAQVFTLGAGLKITAAACGGALTGAAAAAPPPLLLLGIAAVQLGAALLYVRGRPRPRTHDGEPDKGGTTTTDSAPDATHPDPDPTNTTHPDTAKGTGTEPVPSAGR